MKSFPHRLFSVTLAVAAVAFLVCAWSLSFTAAAPTTAPAPVRLPVLVHDGVTDDGPGINAMIDAAPNMAVLDLAPGIYCIKSQINPRGKSLMIRGSGWGLANEGLPGAQQWSDLGIKSSTGTILWFTGKSGSAIDLPLNFNLSYRIHDLAIIGMNVPGVSGISAEWNTRTDNVLVANFDTGISGHDLVQPTFFDTHVRGCNVGWSFTHCTIGRLDQCSATWCAKSALRMVWCNGFTFTNFDSETNRCALPEVVLSDDGDPTHGCWMNTFQNSWAESALNPSGLLFDIPPSTHNTIINQLDVHGGTAERIRDRGVGTIIGPMYSVPWGGGDLVPLATTRPAQ